MAERNDVQVLIGSKHNKWSHNSSDDSWYAENFTQEGSSEDRPSFHYPNLERWLLRATQRYERGESKYNPFIGTNLTFIFHDKETVGGPIEQISPRVIEYAQKVFKTTKPFTVYMFDWDLGTLTTDEVQQIFSAIHASFTTHSFSDPLGMTVPQTLIARPSKAIPRPKGPTVNNTSHKKPTIREGQTIKLNESQLREVIAESVKKVFSELYA